MQNRILWTVFILLTLVLAACGNVPVVEPTVTEVTSAETNTPLPAATNPVVEPVTTDPVVEPVATEPAAVDTDTPVPPIAAATNTPVPPPTAPPLPTSTPLPPTAVPVPTVPSEVLIEVDNVELPPGFSMTKFTTAQRPVALTFDKAGYLWTTHQFGEIYVQKDTTGDGRADFRQQFSFGFDWPNGIAIHPDSGDIYVSQKGKISILRDFDGDFVADEVVNFIDGLPFGLHHGNSLIFADDGWLYMGLGSTCDACDEVDERSATIMRFNTDTGESEIYATGLRNPFDLAFHPETGAMFATDNGRDDLGDTMPREELNHIVKGFDYGWPNCWDAGLGDDCAGTKQAVGYFQAHSSTNALQFYTADQFPTEYHNILFATVFGSWFVPDIIQQGIQQITITPDGGSYSAETEWFMQWDGWMVGIALGPDGALYFGDYNISDPEAGAIYRISYGLP